MPAFKEFTKENVARLDPYVPGFQPDPNDHVLKLNANENAYGPSPRVLEALRSHINGDLRLYPNSKAIDLRLKVAEVYGVKKDQVICANGSDEIISMIFRTFVPDGEVVQFTYPTYTYYKTQADIYDVPYRYLETGDDFLVDMDAYLENPTHLSFVSNPNSPTGTLLSAASIEDCLKKYPGLLVVDEAYIDFGGAKESAIPLIDKYPNLLVLRTFSKSFALCGMRVGYAFGQSHLIAALDKTKDSYNIAHLNQIAAIAALDDYEYMLSSARKIAEDREWFASELAKIGFTLLPSLGNYVFVKHPKMEAETIYQNLLERRILVRFFSQRRVSEYIRISIGTHDEMERVLAAIKELLA
ncbi:MAG: histidinol-phosphate transaminase [Syntrophomonadaceae bacterium]|nr:histidinol-phosphate transaminase [Syntrophomonadaceae bacterium]